MIPLRTSVRKVLGVEVATTSESVHRFRLIIVSPSDVTAYREVVERVVAELNRSEFDRRGVIVFPWRWEVDAVPQLSSSGPQTILDEQMHLEDSHLVVAIFWTRIGTVGPDGKTGTEHEIERALASWRRTGRPNVAVYFCMQPTFYNTEDDITQALGVLRFKSSIRLRQLFFEVTDQEDFENNFRRHLLSQVSDLLEGKRPQKSKPSVDEDVTRSMTQYCPPPDFFAKYLFDQEIERAAQSGLYPFWWDRRDETLWMGNLFAFWVQVPGINAKTVRITVSSSIIDRSEYSGLQEELEHSEISPRRPRAAFEHMSGFTSDVPTELHVAPIELSLMRYVEVYWKEFLQRNPRCSAFGVIGLQPIPSITVVHCFVVTSDGWIILARRSAGRNYYPRAWSASFEKHALLASPSELMPSGDTTIFETVSRGVLDELGVAPSRVRRAEVVSVGRECVLAPTGLVINLAVICSVFIRQTLEEVWSQLRDLSSAIDRTENDAWAGLRVDAPERLTDIVSSSRLGSVWTISNLSGLTGVELEMYGGSLREAKEGILLWHPTSAARLGLCAAVMSQRT
jgi:hypothetical protein